MDGGSYPTCFAEGMANHVSRCGAVVEYVAGSSRTASPSGGSPARQASVQRPSARCSINRYRSHMGRGVAGTQSSATLASVQRMVEENATLPPSARTSIKTIYEHIRDQEGFRGSYQSVTDYARLQAPDTKTHLGVRLRFIGIAGEKPRNRFTSLSRVDPRVVSTQCAERLFRDAGRVVSYTPKPDRREQARQVAFEWMRAVLQKDVSPDALRRDVGNVPDLSTLLNCLYDGRLSDRNRVMTVLANRHGLSGGTVCSFLGIDNKTRCKYLQTFESGGQAALLNARPSLRVSSTMKRVKHAVFRLLHEPPSNYGINRTTWIMPDLARVLRETGHPACP